MLWKIDELIAYVSRYFTLKIGDIISRLGSDIESICGMIINILSFYKK